MATAAMTKWTPGTDLPYVLPIEGAMLAIRLPAEWVKADRAGQPTLLPPAVRAVDRLRALFETRGPVTKGLIISLRQALEMSQEAFGRRLGVSKITVSRWECGRMKPSADAARRIRKLQHEAQQKGVRIDGAKRVRAA